MTDEQLEAGIEAIQRVSPSMVSDLNKKIYGTIEAWRNRPIEGEHLYVYLDGIVLKRSWAGEVRNVSLLVAIAVNGEGYREILGICEGAKERTRRAGATCVEEGVGPLAHKGCDTGGTGRAAAAHWYAHPVECRR
jgi:transposase-like protein